MMVIFAALAMVSRAIGTAEPPNPALMGFIEGCEDTPQPCWYGLVPGVSTLREIGSQLHRFGYELGLGTTDRSLTYISNERSPGCVQINFDIVAAEVSAIILGCTDVRAGDVTVLLGRPDYRLWYTRQDSDWIYGRTSMRLSQVWANSAFETIQYLRMARPRDVKLNSPSTMPWQGFLPRWRYCQLQPMYSGCQE
jgi:hypothetical protein